MINTIVAVANNDYDVNRRVYGRVICGYHINNWNNGNANISNEQQPVKNSNLTFLKLFPVV